MRDAYPFTICKMHSQIHRWSPFLITIPSLVTTTQYKPSRELCTSTQNTLLPSRNNATPKPEAKANVGILSPRNPPNNRLLEMYVRVTYIAPNLNQL